MAVLTVQRSTAAGLNPSYVAASAGGDSFDNDGHVMLHVQNGGAAPITVTLVSPRACDQGYNHNEPVTVPNGDDRMIVFPTARWNDSNDQVNVTYSAVTNVTVAAIRV